MGPDNDRRRAKPDKPITKEEAAMEPMVGNDEVTMAKTMMRAKKLLMMKMFVVAEVMRMEMTATKA
jgi:hypothetical protein